jgi:hypothetical protein
MFEAPPTKLVSDRSGFPSRSALHFEHSLYPGAGACSSLLSFAFGIPYRAVRMAEI